MLPPALPVEIFFPARALLVAPVAEVWLGPLPRRSSYAARKVSAAIVFFSFITAPLPRLQTPQLTIRGGPLFLSYLVYDPPAAALILTRFSRQISVCPASDSR